MGLTKKEKQALEKSCYEGDQQACADVGKDEAKKHKHKFLADQSDSIMGRFIIGIIFWVSMGAMFLLSLFYIFSIELMMFILPFLVGFGVLMIVGEKLKPLPRIFWVAGISILATFSLFHLLLLIFEWFEWSIVFIAIYFTALMIVYIILFRRT